MMPASQDMGLLMVRLNLMAKGTNSIIATNLYKEKCFDKVTNLSICLLYKSRCLWECLLKTGDNHCRNDPLQRTPSTKHHNIPVTGFYRESLDNSHILQSLPEKCYKNYIFRFFTQVILTKRTCGAKGMFSKCLYLFSSQHSYDGTTQPVKAARISYKNLATLGRHLFSAKIVLEKMYSCF